MMRGLWGHPWGDVGQALPSQGHTRRSGSWNELGAPSEAFSSLPVSCWFCACLLICFIHLSEVLSTLHCNLHVDSFAHWSYSADSLNLSRTLCPKGEQLMATFIKPGLSSARCWSKCSAGVSSLNTHSHPTRSASL